MKKYIYGGLLLTTALALLYWRAKKCGDSFPHFEYHEKDWLGMVRS